MSKYIKKFALGSPERTQLHKAAELLEAKSPNGWGYHVGETWFDYGQGWAWTTILCDGGSFGGYQALSPRAQEEIILANSDAAMEQAVDSVLSGKYCPDRIKN